MFPVASTLPKATNLDAANAANSIRLTWETPLLDGSYAEPVTYDFEDGDPFADEYGDFIFVDVDGSPVGGFQNMEIPNITSGETTGSFWVWDQDMIDNSTFKAHSGSKYLFALYRADNNKSDEWAITPELAGNAQTISFYARSYSIQYPERLEMYYSTGSTDTSDFIKIENTGGTVPSDWTLYEVNVPEGAKRFAIRSCASGSFMLLVDDMTLTPGFNIVDLSIEGYNIYRDGQQVNDSPVKTTEFEDSNVIDGTTYDYLVTVLYKDKGESAASNMASILFKSSGADGVGEENVRVSATDGCVVIDGAIGLDVEIIGIDGISIYDGIGTQSMTIQTGSGVFIVKIGNVVYRIAVS